MIVTNRRAENVIIMLVVRIGHLKYNLSKSCCALFCTQFLDLTFLFLSSSLIHSISREGNHALQFILYSLVFISSWYQSWSLPLYLTLFVWHRKRHLATAGHNPPLCYNCSFIYQISFGCLEECDTTPVAVSKLH